MNLRKRLFAILMSLTMVLTYMPALAFAETEAPASADASVTEDAQNGDEEGTPAEEPAQEEAAPDADSGEAAPAADEPAEADSPAAPAEETPIAEPAEQIEEEPVPEVEQSSDQTATAYKADNGLGDEDELLMQYFEKQFGGKASADTGKLKARRASRRSTLDERGQYIYDEMLPQIQAIANGEETDPTVTVDVSSLGLEDGSEYDLEAVVNALTTDYPYEFYWYDKTDGIACGGDAENATEFFSVTDAYKGELKE